LAKSAALCIVPIEGTKQASGNRRRAILGGSSKNTRDSWQFLSQSYSQTYFLLSFFFFAGYYRLFSFFFPFLSFIPLFLALPSHLMPLEGVGGRFQQRAARWVNNLS